ncbi:MAG: helix-hairpin-helix domain-containing protein [Chlorobiaceae bacterium]|nr:helix-hairpin-helix domain-containing protein [Chlorobiaceae bacterium]
MKFLNDLAVRLGITRAEMTAVTLLTFFLLLGGGLQYSGAVQDADSAIRRAEAAQFSEADVDSLLAIALKEKNAPMETAATPVMRYSADEPVTKTSSRRAPKKKLTGKIAFGTASAAQLQQIPGVGPVMARRLIEFRQRKGGKVEHFNDFLEVKGIGKKKLEHLKQHLILN